MDRSLLRIAFSVFVLALAGCEAAPEKTTFGKKVETAGMEDKSFGLFWNDFRKAVLADDMETLISLTEFKLETRGSSESDPVILYSEKEFPLVFHAFLGQMAGQKGKQVEKEIELIERTKTLTSVLRDGFSQVGGMEFTKKDGKWKLTGVHLNSESMMEITDQLMSK